MSSISKEDISKIFGYPTPAYQRFFFSLAGVVIQVFGGEICVEIFWYAVAALLPCVVQLFCTIWRWVLLRGWRRYDGVVWKFVTLGRISVLNRIVFYRRKWRWWCVVVSWWGIACNDAVIYVANTQIDIETGIHDKKVIWSLASGSYDDLMQSETVTLHSSSCPFFRCARGGFRGG